MKNCISLFFLCLDSKMFFKRIKEFSGNIKICRNKKYYLKRFKEHGFISRLLTVLAIPVLLCESVSCAYKGHPHPPFQVVGVTSLMNYKFHECSIARRIMINLINQKEGWYFETRKSKTI